MSKVVAELTNQNGRTVLSDCSFSAPLKIAKPFYRDDGYTEIMLMCASPGMLSGDCFDIQFTCGANSHTIISGQSYQKLFNTGDEMTRQNIRIQVGENASLFYCPYPVIPFAGNKFHSKVNITLHPTSKLLFGDILVCGRQGMGERFAFEEYRSRTIVSLHDRPIFLEGSRLIPQEVAVDGIGFFEGRSCQGVLYLHGYENISLPESCFLEAAVSQSYEGYTVRMISDYPDEAYQFAQKLFLATATI